MEALKFTLEDIAKRPKAYQQALGIYIPTFAEFAANPEKFKGRKDEILECVQNGPDVLRNVTGKMYYYVGKHKVESLEKAEQVATDLGWDIATMEFKVNLEKGTAGKYETHVHFVRGGKDEADQG